MDDDGYQCYGTWSVKERLLVLQQRSTLPLWQCHIPKMLGAACLALGKKHLKGWLSYVFYYIEVINHRSDEIMRWYPYIFQKVVTENASVGSSFSPSPLGSRVAPVRPTWQGKLHIYYRDIIAFVRNFLKPGSNDHGITWQYENPILGSQVLVNGL